MAFATEFVLGAGGGVDQIPVSMSGTGGSSTTPLVFPLTTVNAGTGAWVIVEGTLSPNSIQAVQRPHLQIGSVTFENPAATLTGAPNSVLAAKVSGIVQIAVLSRYGFNTTTLTGTVYVARL